jgi:uncharacterized membrane protein
MTQTDQTASRPNETAEPAHIAPSRLDGMAATLRVLRLLLIVVWVGGLIFFAFVLAPVAFQVLPTTHEAGTIVGATLRILNTIGDTCGFVFILTTLVLFTRISPHQRKPLRAQLLVVLLMLAATGYVQVAIVPAMERDRVAAGGDIDAAPPDNPYRLDFERLHPLSEKVEGSAILLGLGLVVLLGLEGGDFTTRKLNP